MQHTHCGGAGAIIFKKLCQLQRYTIPCKSNPLQIKSAVDQIGCNCSATHSLENQISCKSNPLQINSLANQIRFRSNPLQRYTFPCKSNLLQIKFLANQIPCKLIPLQIKSVADQICCKSNLLQRYTFCNCHGSGCNYDWKTAGEESALEV